MYDAFKRAPQVVDLVARRYARYVYNTFTCTDAYRQHTSPMLRIKPSF